MDWSHWRLIEKKRQQPGKARRQHFMARPISSMALVTTTSGLAMNSNQTILVPILKPALVRALTYQKILIATPMSGWQQRIRKAGSTGFNVHGGWHPR